MYSNDVYFRCPLIAHMKSSFANLTRFLSALLFCWIHLKHWLLWARETKKKKTKWNWCLYTTISELNQQWMQWILFDLIGRGIIILKFIYRIFYLCITPIFCNWCIYFRKWRWRYTTNCHCTATTRWWM